MISGKFFSNLIKILILIFLLFILGNNWGCAVNPNYLEREEVAKVIATGYGNTTQESSDNAFGEALRKAFGARINSEQRVKNRVLVQDTISVSAAEKDSRIKHYKILEQSKKDGIYFTKIEALVSTTHLTKVSNERRIIREEWNQFIGGTNPLVGIGQVGMKIGQETKNYWVSWFGKPRD